MRCAILLAVLAAIGGCDRRQPPRVFVSDERGDHVIALEPGNGNVVASIAAGRRPRGIHLSPDGTTLYVAISGSPIGGPGVDESKLPPADRRADGIAVIDTATLRVRRVLPAGTDPETFTVSLDGKTLFVSNEDASEVSAVDAAGVLPTRSGKVGDQPEGIAVTRDGKRVFVACEGADAVLMLDASTLRQRASTAIAGRPRGLFAAADGSVIYVSVEFGGKLAVLDARNGHLIRLIDLARGDETVRPMGIVEGPDGGKVYVSTGRAGAVLEVDPTKGTVVRRFDHVGSRPWGMALSSDGRTLFTANGPWHDPSGGVSSIRLSDGTIQASWRIGSGPWGVTASR